MVLDGDEEIDRGYGPVETRPGMEGYEGATRGTNNTGEVEAVIRALRWAIETRPPHVMIRYDSKYAANMTRGTWIPKKDKKTGLVVNGELIKRARDVLHEARMLGIEVWWKHVKGCDQGW